jgi:tetratricopeptide (TPR) repeat protein
VIVGGFTFVNNNTSERRVFLTLSGVINERYSIEREIGRGGMATVYLARDIRHGSRVALKILTSDFASMVSGERFTREIRITAGLQHPHILPVFDSGAYNGLPYYVMPFVDGPTLAEKIRKDGALSIEDALEIAAEVADALQHAHAQGIVHRDIKPSNILLAHGHAVVADFGVARAVEAIGEHDLTRTGIAVGTAAYMSPEQAAGEEVDGRSDVYSLGCVLYEMIAGVPPYTAPTARALMAKHWTDDVPSLRAVRSSVRSSIEALVQKTMAKRQIDRFQTAGQLEDAIKNVSTEERLAAIGYTPSEEQPAYSPPSGDMTATNTSTLTAAPSIKTSEYIGGFLRGALAVLAVVAVALGAWRFSRPRESGLDRNRVVIYPLVVPDDFKGSRNVGEDIGTMIGTALDGTAHIRWIDGWPLLTPGVRQDIRTLSGTDARNIARSRRAAWYLTGRLVARGDSAEVFLELNDVAGDSTVARGRAIGVATDAWRTGLHAINALLPSLIPPGIERQSLLDEWNDRNPTAVASFLLGESAFRRVHLSEALQHYRDALKADSTFGLAAIRGAQAAAWNHRSDEAAMFIQAALRQPMSPRYTHFARGYEAYNNGAADSAVRELNRGIALDPEMSAAWMQLGEVYTHLLPKTGHLDSLARVAFDEAHRLDPSARNLLLHSIEIRLREGEIAEAGVMVRDFLKGDPDTLLAEQIKVMYSCARSGTQAVDWRDAARRHPLAVLASSNSFKGGAQWLPCAMRGYEAVMRSDTSVAAAGRRWSSTVGLASSYLALNQPAEARAVIDSSIARGWGGSSFFLTAGVVSPEMRDAARATAAKDEKTFGPNYSAATTLLRLWQLGVFESLYGRKEVAAAVARSLADQAKASGAGTDLRLAKSMAAFSTLARGDSASAMKMFDSIVGDPVPGAEIVWDVAAPRGMERLTLARMLVKRRDYRKAIDVANVFDTAWPSVYLLYVPASLELRAEAAAAIPDGAMASRFRSRLAALRSERAVAGK